MNGLDLTSVDVFVIVVCLVLGYLVVAHFLEPKPRVGGESRSTDGGGAADQEEPPQQARATSSMAHWEGVLGVSRYAPPDEVRRAYRAEMAKYHPDKVAALGDELKVVAERKSKEINAAYAAACRDKGMG